MELYRMKQEMLADFEYKIKKASNKLREEYMKEYAHKCYKIKFALGAGIFDDLLHNPYCRLEDFKHMLDQVK